MEPSDVTWRRTHGIGADAWNAVTPDAPHGGAAHVVAYETTVWLFDGGHNRLSEHPTVVAAIETGTAWIVADRRRNGTLQQQRETRRQIEADARWRRRYGIGDPEVVGTGTDQDHLEPDPDARHDDR